MNAIKQLVSRISLFKIGQSRMVFLFALCIYMQSLAQTAPIHTADLYNENVYLILDYPVPATSGNTSIPALLDTGLDGFMFHLQLSPVTGEIFISKAGTGFTPLEDALTHIRSMLEKDSARIFTLILDFGFSASYLQPIMTHAGLEPYIFDYQTGSDWPELQYLINRGQRLVVFSTQSVPNRPHWLNNLSDLSGSPLFNTSGELKPPENMQHLDARKSLMVFNGYRSAYLQVEGDFLTFTRNRPHVIDLFVDTWTTTGKMPNFIMIDNLKWLGSDFQMKLRSFGFVKGMATFNSNPLHMIEWEGINSISQGKFSFPLLPGDKITLIPHCPGYRFKPRSMVVDNPSSEVLFKAYPVLLARELELYLPLRKNTRDWSPFKRNGKASGVRFVKDPVQGQVAELSNGSTIGIDKAEVLQMTDHSFTVAVWLKIHESDSLQPDIVVLGSKTFAYQRGLHLVIRQKKPYMGFFNNDLSGNTEISEEQWVHLVWRYNKLSGEQAVYVNGRLDANAFNRHSYKGVDSLFVGLVGFNDKAGFPGNLSELTIWSRPLGDEEIMGLYNRTLRLPVNGFFFWRWPRWSIPIILLTALALTTILVHRNRKGKKQLLPRISTGSPQGIPSREVHEKNLIRLFGDFTVVDKQGNNLANLFTPKLKQLFIALLIHSTDGKKGLSPAEISEMLWKGQPSRETKNKRAVTLRHLRIALAGMPEISIIVDNHWLISIPDTVYCDYIHFLRITRTPYKNHQKTFEEIREVIRHGEAFKDESHEWLDDVKNETGTCIIDLLLNHLSGVQSEMDPQGVLEICDQIFMYDPSNEAALSRKLKVLVSQNKINQAKLVYDRFCALYGEMYGENYEKSFNQLTHN